LGVVGLFFSGGLLLGGVQALGYLPAAGMESLTLAHVQHVLYDPDFFRSLLLTLYIALTSTVIAAGISVAVALGLLALAGKSRAIHFIFQIPLTVPHLVIAVAVVFMLAPTGFVSRLLQHLGLLTSSAQFPLLINDRWGIGILTAYVWKEIPFITMMLLSVLRNTGSELLDVGKTLKATRWQRLRYIILPTISPSLGAASLIVFAFTFGAFEAPFLLGQTYPMMLPVWAYKSYSDVDLMARPEGIATGLVIAIVVVMAILLSHAVTRAAKRRGVII
jgi:putative spermidine/putrescine transport system permease protein